MFSTPVSPARIHFHSRMITTLGTTMGKVKAVLTTYCFFVDFTAYSSSAASSGKVRTMRISAPAIQRLFTRDLVKVISRNAAM